MIPVSPQPEPDDFDEKVRKPGTAWLAHNPTGKPEDYPAYWRKALPDLRVAYRSVCAYYCYFLEACDSGTVDHFVPKSKRPDLTYEWTNYRFACSKANARKGIKDDVLDPFTLETETFLVDAVTGAIVPNPTLSPQTAKAAWATIERLGLDRPDMRDMRTQHIDHYLHGNVSLYHLDSHSPFVAYEIRRNRLQPVQTPVPYSHLDIFFP